ncbi:MAG: PAS domain S-box protein [Deltaproteobacteria bacterium]|nr:PAS domain S-box protein [Deltaproteobacteria bacterium]
MLRDSETLALVYSQIFENSPDMMLILDDRYVIQKVNPAYAAFRAVTEERALGRPLSEVVGKTFFEEVARPKIDEAFNGNVSVYQGWIEQAHLGRRFIDARHYPLAKAEGERARWVAVVLHDLTREKEAADERERLTADLQAKSAELALQRARLEEVIRQMPAGVVVTAPSGEIVLGNERMAEIWRLPICVGTTIEAFRGGRGFHREGRPYEPEEWPIARSLAREETVTGEEIEIARGDGQRGFISASSAPVRDATGSIVGAVVVHLDITGRKQMEEELRGANEALRIYEEVIDRSPDFITVLDRRYSYRMVNPAYARLRGTSQKDLIGRRAGEFIGEEFFSTAIQPFLDRCFAGETVCWQGWFQYPAAELRWMEVTGFPLPKEDGVDLVVTVLRDMTARKRAEEERDRLFIEAQRRAAELDAAINSMPEGAVIYGTEGEILRLNRAAERLLGRAPGDAASALQGTIVCLETPEGRALSFDQAPSSRALRGETVRGQVLRCLGGDGRMLWFSCSAAPIRAHDGTPSGAIALFDDITRLHEMEEQREDLLRIVSHDLRSPLVSVGGFAERLRRRFEEVGEEETERKYLGYIADGARQMSAIIENLVESTRLESGQVRLEKEFVELGAFTAGLLERAGDAMDRRRIRLEVPPDLPPVLADPHQLERILTNLLTNALKYSPAEAPVTLKAEHTGHEVTVSVMDRGPGIVPEELPRLFDKFYRTKETQKAEGLGLGLYITRMLIQAQGGRVWAESERGKGSAFRFTLGLASSA